MGLTLQHPPLSTLLYQPQGLVDLSAQSVLFALLLLLKGDDDILHILSARPVGHQHGINGGHHYQVLNAR